jgi:uncharacterized protein YegL
MPANYTMILDTSGSMSARVSDNEEMKDYCMLDIGKLLMLSFLNCMEKNTVNLISFSSNVKQICENYDIDSREDLESLINLITPSNTFIPSGSTSMFSSLIRAIQNLKHSNSKNYILLLTDGIPSDINYQDFISKLQEYNQSIGNVEFELYTISIGNGANTKFLSDLSNNFGGTMVFVSDIGMVSSVFVNTMTNILQPRCKHPNEKQIKISEFFVSGIENLNGLCENRYYSDAQNAFLNMKQVLYSIINDQSAVNDYLEQVGLAIREEYYKTWGSHYLYSLQAAHKRYECHNFVDKSVTIYTDLYPEEWEETIDKIESIYNTIPIQDPCYPPFNSSRTNIQTISLQSYGHSIGCLHEDSLVTMSENKTKRCKDILPGDNVLVLNNGIVEKGEVEFVIKTKTSQDTKMIKIPDGCKITEWHPIWLIDQFVFPKELTGIEMVDDVGKYMYSFVLKNRDECMFFDGIPAVNLAHNIQSGIAKHDFWGTEKVLKNYLRYYNNSNIITINRPFPIRDMENNVFSVMNTV